MLNTQAGIKNLFFMLSALSSLDFYELLEFFCISIRPFEWRASTTIV